MDKTLERLADTIKDEEYEELFPNTPVEKAKQNKEKVKTALFQVRYIVWNEELYNRVHNESENYYVKLPEIKEMASDKEFQRIQKQLRGATVQKNEDGETLVPKTDLKDVLSTRKGLMD